MYSESGGGPRDTVAGCGSILYKYSEYAVQLGVMVSFCCSLVESMQLLATFLHHLTCCKKQSKISIFVILPKHFIRAVGFKIVCVRR